jgi:hypothetical protein
MKAISVLSFAATVAALSAADPSQPAPAPVEKPPIAVGAPAPGTEQVYTYEQKPMAGRPVLIAPEQAKALIDRFKIAYPKLGSPRIAMVVNRDLVDENNGLKLTGRTEKTQQNKTELKSNYKADPNAPSQPAPTVPPGGNVTIVGNVNGLGRNVPGSGDVNTSTEKVTTENTYSLKQRAETTLADKQTVRDVERLFGRPLRMAGARLADQKAAAQLLADNPARSQNESETARKDREALSKIADVVVEVLISSRQINVPEISGEKVYTVPDIQATAIQLKDSKILGQATASDIIGKDRFAGNIVRNFDVREIAEATALALMEDMMLVSE